MDKRPHPIEHLANDAEIASKAHIYPLPGKRKRKYPLRVILIVLLPVLAYVAFAIYDRVTTYPGSENLNVYPGAQRISYVHADEDALNSHYEAVHWTADPVGKVTDYYSQQSVVSEKQSETGYHLIYLTDPNIESSAQNDIRKLDDCRVQTSLRKLANCYSVVVIDLPKTAGYFMFESLPAWFSPSSLPSKYEGTLIYQQWWTTKSY